MENVKFTKGPWYRQAISDRIRILTGTGMAKRVIAVLKDSALPQEQIIGNSYLIAAVPDLYEACTAINSLFAEPLNCLIRPTVKISNAVQEQIDAAFNKLDAAIAKAEGREGQDGD